MPLRMPMIRSLEEAERQAFHGPYCERKALRCRSLAAVRTMAPFVR